MLITTILEHASCSGRKSFSIDYEALVPSFDRSLSVSRNLFQICLGKGGIEDGDTFQSLPSEIQDAISQLQSANNGWNYQLYDTAAARAFILNNYGTVMLSYFERISPEYGAARADFLRYLLLYRFGGVYIDLKCGLARSLDETVSDCVKFPVFFWDNMPAGNHHPAIPDWIREGEILQGFIVAPAGHQFLREVIIEVMKRIDCYNPYTHGVGYGGTMKITGPGVYTETIYNCMNRYPEDCFVARPFADYGFILRAVNAELPPGTSNYRKQHKPLISSGNKLLDTINSLYLKLLFKKRNQE